MVPAAAERDQRLAVLFVPASILRPGDYIVKLSGVGKSGQSEEVDVYAFRTVLQQSK
jgi:hypothetical protein